MLHDITPVVLTYNEAPNIARTLSRLAWAKDIVVVDSNSDDGTVDILAAFPAVRVFRRVFDTHARQWRFATQQTGIRTDWILRLDADYQVTPEFVHEIARLDPGAAVGAYRAAFDYEVFGRRLRASLYPPNTVLLRRGTFDVYDDGHTERWVVKRAIGTLRSRLVHDDRKPLLRWLMGQYRYMSLEAARLDKRSDRMADRLRCHPPLMPVVTFLYCLLGKGLLFKGRAGLHYALQRLVAEGLLALMVLERKLTGPATADPRRSAERQGDEAEN